MDKANGRYEGLHFSQEGFSLVKDALAVEESLSISINDEPFTITMRTPGDEKELVRGLLFSEGLYRDTAIDPVVTVTGKSEKGYITNVNVVIPEEKLLKDFSGTRNIASVSSCGLCGKTSFEAEEACDVIHEERKLDPVLVSKMFDIMSSGQAAFRESGGTHASALFNIRGELLSVKEDIGRHNAVDKVIGDLLLKRKLEEAACLTVSGRISYEIVSKAISAGIPFLASVSAPSGMAVETAEKAGMTLMAFCRRDKLTVYSHPERMLREETHFETK